MNPSKQRKKTLGKQINPSNNLRKPQETNESKQKHKKALGQQLNLGKHIRKLKENIDPSKNIRKTLGNKYIQANT